MVVAHVGGWGGLSHRHGLAKQARGQQRRLSAWVAAKNAVDKEKDGKYSERWQRDGLNVRYDAPDDAPPPDVPAAKPPPAAASNSTAAPDAASTTQQSSRLGSMMKPWSRSKQKSAE